MINAITQILVFLAFIMTGKGILQPEFTEAEMNARRVNEGFNRCISYVNAWTGKADTPSMLIPRNISESRDYWNAWDAAADNYPFMVLTSSILMPDYFSTTAIKMLESERRLTSRIGALPDTYSFSAKGFRNNLIDTSQVIFGSAEYMKDGLIPITEWLGQSPWSDRMLEILNDLKELVRVVKSINGAFYGQNAVVEVNGDLLQVLSRMYWFTGNKEYLDWAVEIADYYLNDQRLPTLGSERLRIRDHGCEIISGLCEVYLAASYSLPAKKIQWQNHVHKMLDRILEIGRNADGLFYDEINPVTGEILSSGIGDNFGYTLNAYYFIGKLDNKPEYIDAVKNALNSLNVNYRKFDWENGSCDGYADAIEGTLNLYNREPIPSVHEWLDSEIEVMWNFQKPDGMIEGWHGDGNFARTTIMYCLWKTQGLLVDKWDKDLFLGAESENGVLKVAFYCENSWEGKIKFDTPRYATKMHLVIDYPRINQFQQWFTVKDEGKYEVNFISAKNSKRYYSGKELIAGIPFKIRPGERIYFSVKKI